MFKNIFIIFFITFSLSNTYSQRLLSESVSFVKLQEPTIKLNLQQKTFKYKIQVPYTMKMEDLEKVSKEEFQDKLANYDNVVKQSEIDHQQQLKDHEKAIIDEKEKFRLESEQFSKLSLIERLTLTEQGKKPQLRLPSKPIYQKPSKPIYSNPNVSDYLIFDTNVMESKMNLKGYEKGESGIYFEINFSTMQFQDNANQVYGKQPTSLKVKVNNQIVEEKLFANDFTMLTSGSTASIRKNNYENSNVEKILNEIQLYVNDVYGYKSVNYTSKIFFIKNKGEYDDLEKAKVFAVSGFNKMKASNSPEVKVKAMIDINKAIELWKSKLELINYKDKNAIYNSNVAKAILFNLIGVYVDTDDKKSAEEYFSILQENKVQIKFDYDEESYYKILESSINRMK